MMSNELINGITSYLYKIRISAKIAENFICAMCSVFSNLFVSVEDLLFQRVLRDFEFPKSSEGRQRNLTNLLRRRQSKNVRHHYERMRANFLCIFLLSCFCFFHRREWGRYYGFPRTKICCLNIHSYSNKS